MIKKNAAGFIALMPVLMLFSCDNSLPSISETEVRTVFEYTDYNSFPRVFLSLFVKPSSQPARAESVLIIHEQSGLRWQLYPILIGDGSPSTPESMWVGFPRIYAAPGSSIPEGSYRIIYTDLAKQTAISTFNIAYPNELLHMRADEATARYAKQETSYLSIYNEQNELIYFTLMNVPEWTNMGAIQKSLAPAAYIRISFDIDQPSVICLLPRETEIENTMMAHPADIGAPTGEKSE